MKFNNIFVVSAVNIINGGPFTVLRDCLENFSRAGEKLGIKIVAIVNSKQRLDDLRNVQFIEYPKAKKNYMFRFFYEYIVFFLLSIRLKPKYWFSLHDMTPNVYTQYQYVYMHNPSPFYKESDDGYLSLKFKLFIKFYKYIYKINVKKNTAIVVQQKWLREEISSLCKFPKERIIVATPITANKKISNDYEKNLFFYPAYPREFKNFEKICEANKLLEEKKIANLNWKIVLTFDGTENQYSKILYEKYGNNNTHLNFVGLLPIEEVYNYYNKAECLLFPSKLETWGLPISEFKVSGKKIILIDLPYAHESAGGANQVAFFKYNDAHSLANLMLNVIQNTNDVFKKEPEVSYDCSFSKDWNDLFNILLQGGENN